MPRTSTSFRRSAAFVLIALAAELVGGEEVSLLVSPMASPDPSSVAVTVSAGAFGTSSDSSAISGTILLQLEPSALAPETARITEMQLTVDDELSFRLASGLLRASAPPGTLSLNLVQPGAAAMVADGRFEQIGNSVGLGGVISLSGQMIDLSEQDPAEIDFQGTTISRAGRALTLQSSVTAIFETEIDTGVLGSIPLTIDVEGGTIATGIIPRGLVQWRPEVGLPGDDGALWSNGNNWTRNQLPDVGPIDGDLVSLPQVSSPVSIDLAGPRRVGRLAVHDSYALSNGSLHLEEAQLTVDSGSRLTIAANLLAESEIQKLGEGDLIVTGQSANVRVDAGRVGGRGAWGSLTVASDGTLVGLLDYPHDQPLPSLQVDGTITLEGAFQVDTTLFNQAYRDPSIRGQRHPFVLVAATDIVGLPNSVRYDETTLAADPTGTSFSLHVGGGLFRRIRISSTQITGENYLAFAGDTNGDAAVDFTDFLAISAAFGGPGTWLEGDFDGTGLIDFADFLALSTAFGTVAEPAVASVPEPGWTPWIMLSIAIVALRPALLACAA